MTCEELRLCGCKIGKSDLLQMIKVPVYYWEHIPSLACVIKLESGKAGIFIDESVKDTEEELFLLAHEWGHLVTNTLHGENPSREEILQNESKANEYAHRILNGIK